VIDSFYLLTLGSYRAFYILNWILRAIFEHYFDPIAVIFGIVQTAFYVDFAWVYFTRQRVKLRNGGIVDSDDMSRGWLVSKMLGRAGGSFDGEERLGSGPDNDVERAPARSRGRWGARGISVSADEGILDPPSPQKKSSRPGDASAKDAELDGILEDNADDESDDGILPADSRLNGSLNGVSNGSEWRNGSN